MRVLLIFLYLVSSSSFADTVTVLNPDRLKEAGVEVVSWYDASHENIERNENNALCTWVTVIFPLVGGENPEYTRVDAKSILRFNGKVLTNSKAYLSKTPDEKRNTASVCLPLTEAYEADITFSYKPADSVVWCSPSFLLTDIKRFLKQ